MIYRNQTIEQQQQQFNPFSNPRWIDPGTKKLHKIKNQVNMSDLF